MVIGEIVEIHQDKGIKVTSLQRSYGSRYKDNWYKTPERFVVLK